MIHIADGAAQERAKYAEIWSTPEYREAHSPGLENVDRFMEVINPHKGFRLIDIGCGAGIAGLEFKKRGLSVDWIDLTDAGLHEDVPRERFIEGPLWSHWGNATWDYGFCCDVMEHIPPEYTMLCLHRIVQHCATAWLQISLVPDVFGPKLLGEPLHLTVRPFDWWLIRLATIGKVKEARDLCGMGLYIVERK